MIPCLNSLIQYLSWKFLPFSFTLWIMTFLYFIFGLSLAVLIFCFTMKV
jgi:hypothetical protein